MIVICKEKGPQFGSEIEVVDLGEKLCVYQDKGPGCDSRGKRYRKRPWRIKNEATVKKLLRKIRRMGAQKWSVHALKRAACTGLTVGRTQSREPYEGGQCSPRDEMSTFHGLNKSHPLCSCCWDRAQSWSPP